MIKRHSRPEVNTSYTTTLSQNTSEALSKWWTRGTIPTLEQQAKYKDIDTWKQQKWATVVRQTDAKKMIKTLWSEEQTTKNGKTKIEVPIWNNSIGTESYASSKGQRERTHQNIQFCSKHKHDNQTKHQGTTTPILYKQ